MATAKNYTPDSTLRTLFLRITATNNTSSGEVITYTLDQLKETVEKFTDRYTKTEFALIAHDKDSNPDGAVALHFHVFMKFAKPVKFKYVKEVFPYGSIQTCRSSNACVQYLIHQNNPEKQQYAKNEIYTNIEKAQFERYFINDKKLSEAKEEDEVNEILEQIADGTIRQFNFHHYINVQLYSKHRTKIDNAFKYRESNLLSDKNRNIDVWFITGDAGSGKTTLAKKYGEQNGCGVCISSSSNDPLQDYMGEDTLILDDLRDSDFKYVELLKILDNHTKSSMKSRYRNKHFEGKLIIITSYRKLEDWYSSIKDEAKEQLYRRISTVIEVDANTIKINRYGESATIDNPIIYLVNASSVEEQPTAENVAKSIAVTIEVLTDEQKADVLSSLKYDPLPF